MTTPAALGQHPLDVHEAYEALARYARDYGRAPLLLVMHAAVPETLRPDLLNLIRVNFLAAQGADPSLEADVLFAPFTTALGGGYYRIDPQVRWHALALLRSLYRHDARPRPRRIAELLWRYVEARQHQASRAADPQLAEFLDIQRWVALAFLDPTGAARAFADALQQAGHASGSVALRLGGLASAIELPLSGQPELIAYARGLDALAGGNDADAERLLGALGDGELRIGDVVLRAPTAVLAEGKGQTATADAGADAPPKRRTCLVITGFGRKTDPATGRVLDLDQSYAMIRSAVEAAGMACVRADGGEATVLGAAHLFQQILASDLVICDLSCRDGNTLYLAGVSLALRPRGILLIADDGFAEYASAAAPRLGLTYASAGDALAPDVQARFSASLRALVDGLFSAELDLPGSQHRPLGSPLYASGHLQPPRMLDAPSPAAAWAAPPSGSERLCFIVQGAGTKTDLTTGRTLDLDATYAVVRDAVTSVGLTPRRGDEVVHSGHLESDLHDFLLDAPFVISDLTAGLPEVLIQLGLRHGLRPGRTLLIAEEQFKLPVELASLRILRYKHLGTDIGAQEARRLQAAIVDWLKAAMASPTVDSPVYAALPTLRPPQRIEAADPPDAEPAMAEAPPEAGAASGPAADEAAPAPPPRVFLSHYQGYLQYALPLAKALHSVGIEVSWYMNLSSGEDFAETLALWLEESDVVIAVVGRQTSNAKNALNEIHRAIALGKRLVPVFVDEGAPSEVLSFMAANVDASGHIAYLAGLKDLALDQALAHAAVRIAAALKPAAPTPEPAAEDALAEPAATSADPMPLIWEITIRQRASGRLHFRVTTADGQHEWQVGYQPALVQPLLNALQTSTRLDVQAAQTLAHLLIPVEWARMAPRTAYRLTVGRETAALPWELLLEDTLWTRELRDPPRVLRHLDGLRRNPGVALASGSTRALVIGDPDTSGMSTTHPPARLPGARQEAETVADTLEEAGFQVTRSLGEGASAVIGKLYGAPFRLLLASGSAVRDYALPDGNRVTGLALGDDVFLTVHELRQLRQLPEVVVLNACHLGQVGADAESATADLVPDLLQAGVPVVVAPAWSVDDMAAAAFSKAFFAALAGNARLEDAVANARIAAARAAPETSTWAAYQAWGDPDFRLFPTAPAAE